MSKKNPALKATNSNTKLETLDSPIYKVKKLVNGKINSIYVFNGSSNPSTENAEELFKNIFTDKENEEINSENISVKFSKQKIYLDDTIGTIKIKILNEMKSKISLDEIYLYCQKLEVIEPVSVYKTITQNSKIPLTTARLFQFTSNIVRDEDGNMFQPPKTKDIYTFDDVYQMNFNNKKYVINKVVGQKTFIVENEFPFTCNPYELDGVDPFFEKSVRKSLSSLNSNLLLNTGNIIENSIFVSFAEDVLSYLNEKDISEQSIMKIYYPFLYNANINTLDELETNRDKQIEKNKRVFNDKTIEMFKTIDMFYDVYNLRKSELNYVSKGIKFIKAVLKPEFEIKIPLEIIFKVIHATQEAPLIKYNPSSRQENVYRLYTDKISTDGRKIPYLKKSVIFKLMKNIGRNKSVAVYIEDENNDRSDNKPPVICEFEEDGYITVSSEFNKPVSISEIDNIFRDTINPIVLEIKNFLEQSGYKLNPFNSLKDENVEISQLTYETKVLINKPLDIEKYRGCISTIFINETNEFKGNVINLRFKRVSNYSKFSSQEAFILEKSEQGLRGEQIIEALLENFPEDLDKTQAIEMVTKVANELEVERGVRKTDIKIKNNPGFKTSISLEKETGTITITTQNINNIQYLETLPIYLDTIVRLTQDKKTTKYSVNDLNKLCFRKSQEEEEVVEDIVSSDSGEVNEDVNYNNFKTVDMNKPKGALSLFFDDDEDEYEDEYEDEDEYIEGGANSSGSSVESEPETEPSIASEKLGNSSKSIISDEKSLEGFGFSISEASVKTGSEASIESIKSLSSVPSLKTPTEEAIKSPDMSSVPSLKTPTEEAIKSPDMSSVPSVKTPSEKKVDLSLEEPQKIASDVTPKKKTMSTGSDTEGENEDEIQNVSMSVSEDEDEDDTNDEVRNIDGMKLNKPYYFQTRIEEKDPILILKEDTPQYNSYPRTCSSNLRRQPVILTDNQLDKINKEHPGFLREEDVIKYGSNPKNQYNYICPRFWCLKNNTFIDPADLKEVVGKDGKKELIHPTCGKVLPKGEKKVKPGYYIYEFYKPKVGKKDYKKYPGLIPDSHPDGLCLPCCFDKYNTEGRIKANEKCHNTQKDENDNATTKKPVGKNKDNEEDEYIKGPDKFPLEPGRWGYLPVEIQTMLREVNADCQISKTNTNIKENHPCLLRHGVEINNKNSFISCISDAIFFGRRTVAKDNKSINVSAILSVKEMKERIIKSISIDSFIKYQNGNLVTDFYDTNKMVHVEVDKYKNSKLYAKLNMDKPEEKAYYSKVICAFLNFIDFLKDDDAFIDHTYLWDIISMPNKYLFPNGVNLVIFQLPKDDITNNVQILCPTNHYSSEFYESRKPTIILMKDDIYYEPIYSYTTSNKKITITKEFKEYDPQLSKSMRAVFKEIIKPLFNAICRPLESMPNVYKAKRPLLLYNLVQLLDTYEYTVKKLVVNFNNKVIGLIAEEPLPSDRQGFIPCYPSSIDDTLKSDLDFVFMTDVTLWNTYTNTVQFLNKLDKRSKKRRDEPAIPCKPAFKIIEDEHVVGVLTNTNQFIQISEPVRLDEIDPDLDIPSMDNDNYIISLNRNTKTNSNKNNPILSEVEITTRQDTDKERVDYIKKIRLENTFYNVFRNTVRILINDYENSKIRMNIEKEMESEYIIYHEKLKNLNKLLRELVKDKIQFIGDENYYKLINEVSTCLVKDRQTCNKTSSLCAVTENGDCNLILPEKNLITKNSNDKIYYSRMADELIRYNRIKAFILQPQSYLSFGNIGYNLKENEIILIQSLLTQEYFDGLVPSVTNKYIKHNSYDEVGPIITQMYDNTIKSLDNAIGIQKENEICIKKTNKHITSGLWGKCFPEDFTEIEYSKFISCSFTLIIDLIERKTGVKHSINKIKNDLFEEYNKYLSEYNDKIIDILIIEGKKTLGDQVRSQTLSFSSLLYSDNYYLTTLDLWLLVTKYKIPTIFICKKFILQTKNVNHEFVGYVNDNPNDDNDKFAFILIPSFRPENIPLYKLVQNQNSDVFIALTVLKDGCIERIRQAIENKVTVTEYLVNFTKPVKKTYQKKKPLKIVDTDTEKEDTPEQNNNDADIEDKNRPVTSEEFIFIPNKNKNKSKTKKQLVIKGNTKKTVKKVQKVNTTIKPLILESSSSN